MDELKNIIQDSNLNFLIGSGLSRPYLATLGNVEALLTELSDRTGLAADVRKIVKCSIYRHYFDRAIAGNIGIVNNATEVQPTLGHYAQLLRTLNGLLLRRKSTILSKEVNLFTTNIDVFLERALEDEGIEYNDGFNGRFKPRFSLSNFKKSHFKRTAHYDNSSELPVFNLVKLHGSLSWGLADKDVAFVPDLHQVKILQAIDIPADALVPVAPDSTLDALVAAATGIAVHPDIDTFLAEYDKQLMIVNPTKEKFRHTVLNQIYYELLRLYSNELERENTVLFVLGFSFADEHVCDITLRAANSNPTLMICVVAHNTAAKAALEEKLKGATNKNVRILAPELNEHGECAFLYDCENIRLKMFESVLSQVEQQAPKRS